jgi:hypothetical protein
MVLKLKISLEYVPLNIKALDAISHVRRTRFGFPLDSTQDADVSLEFIALLRQVINAQGHCF